MNTTSTAANLISKSIKIQHHPTVDMAYAAVAEKISTFLASVNVANASEKIAVKTIIKPIRMSMCCTKYKTKMTIVGNKEDSIAVMVLLKAMIRESSCFFTPLSR